MKTILATILLSAFSASLASAKVLQCASKKDQELYYTQGQLLLEAQVKSETRLQDVNLTLRPEDKLGSVTSEVRTVKNGNWVRFQLDSDAWCSYKLVLPAGFQNGNRAFPAFVDAECEENSNYDIRLNCRLI